MADLNTLYNESGLAGILPYSFGMTGKGYKYLCEKLLNGETLWIVNCTNTTMPLIKIIEEKVCTPIFTNEMSAYYFCNQAAADKINAAPVAVDFGQNAKDIFKRFRDLGIEYLRMDDSVWVDIGDVAPKATYDGFLSINAPLRNAELNATLYYTMQNMRAGIPCDPLISLLWDTLNSAIFLAPIRPKENLTAGAIVDESNTELHIIIDDNGTKYLLIFTDPDFLLMYAAEAGLDHSQYAACYNPSFQTVYDYMKENPDTNVLINYSCGDIVLTLDFLQDIETIALNEHAAE